MQSPRTSVHIFDAVSEKVDNAEGAELPARIEVGKLPASIPCNGRSKAFAVHRAELAAHVRFIATS